VVPEDAWFLIPVSELRTKTLPLPPRERAKVSKYGRFLEAWELLGAGDASRLTIHAAAESDLVLTLIKWKIAKACGCHFLKLRPNLVFLPSPHSMMRQCPTKPGWAGTPVSSAHH
jgi:hypothetical protein